MSTRDDEELEWEERRHREEERDEERRREQREEEDERLQQSADDYERQMQEMREWGDEGKEGAERMLQQEAECMRQQEAERTRLAKMTYWMPTIQLTIQFDPASLDAIENLKPAPPPLAQDLARFGAKAIIAGVIGLGAAVAYHYTTRA